MSDKQYTIELDFPIPKPVVTIQTKWCRMTFDRILTPDEYASLYNYIIGKEKKDETNR